jgi:hypothetical protein
MRLMQLKAFRQFQFFVPPGTHYCWVAIGNVDSNLAHDFFHVQCAGNRTPDSPLSGTLTHAPYSLHSVLDSRSLDLMVALWPFSRPYGGSIAFLQTLWWLYGLSPDFIGAL